MGTFLALTTVSATVARNTLYHLIDEANRSHVPIQITGRRGKAVLISEVDWNAITETIHLSRIPSMGDSIKAGMNEAVKDCYDSAGW